MLMSFTDEELNKLKVFLSRAQSLRNRRLVKDGLPKVSIETHVGRRIGHVTNFPDEEDFRSLLIEIRTFILKKEPNNFDRVCEILNGKLKTHEQEEQFEHIRKTYEEALKETYIFHLADRQVTDEEILDLWLNAKYFHTVEKMEKLYNEIMGEPLFAEPHLKYVLISTVFFLTRCILALSEIIEQVLEDVNK